MTRVIFSIDEALLARIDATAKRLGLSRAAVIRIVMDLHVDHIIHVSKLKP